MIDNQTFKDTLRLFASGITVVTWANNDKIDGLTVSAFCSLSLNPPLVLFCIDHSAYSYAEMCQQSHFAINILAGEQSDIAYQFAGAKRDNLAQIINRDNALSLPVINDAHATLLVKSKERITQGDHDIFIVEVSASILRPESAPLLYHDGNIFSQR